MKPTKKALALVIKNDLGEILIVKRPDTEKGPIAGAWGFPAVVIDDGESEPEAAKRVGKQKLGVEIEILNRIGEKNGDRGDFILNLCDYNARIINGTPKVPQDNPNITQYTDWKYSMDPAVLIPAAKRGSLCSQIYLESIGISWD
ncbi:MAG: NUDIX domain-containing protein [Patescibacteria group bacterium]|jgi:hypothetical protein|nr:NUDIX domain-containing protein [Patescibacteria group bacterium]